MASTPSPSSTLSLSSTHLSFLPQKHPFRQGLLSTATVGRKTRFLKFKFSAVRAVGGSGGTSRSRRVAYRESQSQNQLPISQFKEIASTFVPPALFVAVTFGN